VGHSSRNTRAERYRGFVGHNTALRDIQGLIDQSLLKKDAGGGRSTSYSLNED
jgi:hypothetical protein